MNIKNRLTALEKQVKFQVGEAVVPIVAKTTEEFEERKLEYLKSHTVPGMFIHIVDFSDLGSEPPK